MEPKITHRKGILRALVLSQLGLFGFVFVSVLLQPDALTANEGISYLGVQARTLVFFTLALCTSGGSLFWASMRLPKADPSLKTISILLRVAVFLIIGVLITPYNASPAMGLVHKVFGSLLFITQLVVAAMLCVRDKRDWVVWILFGLQILAGLIAFISLQDKLYWEIQSQLLFQAAFGIILIRSIGRFTASV
jgi:hypothetical protein